MEIITFCGTTKERKI